MDHLHLIEDLLPAGWEPPKPAVRYDRIRTPGPCSECAGTGVNAEDQDGIWADEVCIRIRKVEGEPCEGCGGSGDRMESRGTIEVPCA